VNENIFVQHDGLVFEGHFLRMARRVFSANLGGFFAAYYSYDFHKLCCSLQNLQFNPRSQVRQ
jgi:hypothetical protein